MNTVLGQSELVTLLFYIGVGLLASGRLTRLVVNDDWPPVVKFRVWWDGRTQGSLWQKLWHCPWCAGPYMAALVMALAFGANALDIHLWWFIIMGWLGASYVVSWLVFHDEDE